MHLLEKKKFKQKIVLKYLELKRSFYYIIYQSDFELGYVALNVRNVELQSQYYQQVLGLSVIHQEESVIDLGVGKTILV